MVRGENEPGARATDQLGDLQLFTLPVSPGTMGAPIPLQRGHEDYTTLVNASAAPDTERALNERLIIYVL